MNSTINPFASFAFFAVSKKSNRKEREGTLRKRKELITADIPSFNKLTAIPDLLFPRLI